MRHAGVDSSQAPMRGQWEGDDLHLAAEHNKAAQRTRLSSDQAESEGPVSSVQSRCLPLQNIYTISSPLSELSIPMFVDRQRH